MAMNSWEKQILGHVNRVCDIKSNGDWYTNILITNIDLERNHIIGRDRGGEGVFITFLNATNIIVKDKDNRRPGKIEYLTYDKDLDYDW